MSLYEDLQKLAERIESIKDSVKTEEATKHSFVMPFFQALGYDVFDPTMVVPEFTADVGTKKGEKVDYAIMHEGVPMIIVEVKKHTENLDRYSSQLFRYFGTTNGKFAMLTNGVEYRFYSDMDKANRLDDSPFLIVKLDKLNARDVKALEKFAKSQLSIDSIFEMANKRKYVLEVKDIFKNETKEPSDEFAKFFANKALPGTRLTQNIVDEFKGYVKSAFSEAISDMASDKINNIRAGLTVSTDEAEDEDMEDDNGIITTEEELQGFFIVKSILSEVCPLSKLFARDTKSYFGILFEDNNRKWVARLHFNTVNKYLGIHEVEKQEEKYLLENGLEDIYLHKDKLISAIKRIREA